MKLLAPMLIALAAVVQIGQAADRNAGSRVPADVVKFKERRDLCDHFRGEDPYDAERRKFLEENLSKYCTGTDQELLSLKVKYRNDKSVIRVLEKYEEKIEAGN